ncbi:MAG: RNA polymerase sigma factor [Planctomycetia bacterium]|nr:RNA polymerase sigma factor [Planctomycetia bacterium]
MANPTPHHERLTEWARDHARAVHGYVRALVRDPHAVDDLVQETFCRAWESRHRYAEAGKPRAYLLRIADRLACDRARKLGREQPIDEIHWQQIEPASSDEQPLAALLLTENRRQLDEALAALSEAQRRTLLLRYYGELDYGEIARIMDCPLNTVLSHARRGLLSLRRLLVEKTE